MERFSFVLSYLECFNEIERVLFEVNKLERGSVENREGRSMWCIFNKRQWRVSDTAILSPRSVWYLKSTHDDARQKNL